MSEQLDDIETVPQETVESTTESSTTQEGRIKYIMKIVYKICNALFICGSFIYFMTT
jgi:hypothetical protein